MTNIVDEDVFMVHKKEDTKSVVEVIDTIIKYLYFITKRVEKQMALK